MALKTPLIWDDTRNVARQLQPADGLQLGGGLEVDGPLGFYGAAPLASAAIVTGHWGTALTTALDGLFDLGLLQDGRITGWNTGLEQIVGLGQIGALETGRLILGSANGWSVLDQPALEAGVIKVPVANAGVPQTLPGTTTVVRQLAYSPVLSYGATAPAAQPLAGALWFDTGLGRLKVWTGSAWMTVDAGALDPLLAALPAAGAGRLLVSDGSGAVALLSVPGSGAGGLIPMADGSGTAVMTRLLHVTTTAPWANGASAYSSPSVGGGGRPAGLHHAIWLNTAGNAESLNVWDEGAQQWKGVPVNSPMLQRLASLGATAAEGDLFTYSGGQLSRLPAGTTGQGLTAFGGGVGWRHRFTASASAPASPLDGDFWLDSSDGLWLRSGSAWVDVNRVQRYQAANGSGGTLLPGTAMVHDGSQWRLAGAATARDALVGVALAGANSGAPVSVGVGGVVTLTAAQWSAVIDTAESHAPGSGLIAGRAYYASELTAGRLTSAPPQGRELPVGVALSNTHLLLRPAAPLSARPAVADTQGTAPLSPRLGTLWWDEVNDVLKVYLSGGWQPVAGGDPGSPNPTPVAVSEVEAINWAQDPLAAALRFTFTDNSQDTVVFRGANGAKVTMSDNRTLVIDGGGGGGGGGIAVIDGGRFTV